MPPKKKKGAADDKKLLLGRPGNNVKIGLVGLPNVGKSSTFNLLADLNVPAENYPFCTIDPSEAVVPVPDPRFTDLCTQFKPKKEIPAVLHVTDIAGLVKGAAEGKGLGNAFLSHISAVDAIFHVTRAFKAKDVEHVEGDLNPVRDFEIIRGELAAKDLEKLEKGAEKIARQVKSGNKEIKLRYETYIKAIEMLKAGKDVRHGAWTNKEIPIINKETLLTAKPVVYLVNISRKNFLSQKNKFLADIKKWVKENSKGDIVIPYSVKFEEQIKDMSADERAEFLKENKLPSMLDRIITTGYRALNLMNFFTVGPDEVRAWTMKVGNKAPQAGGVIHGDFEKFFICADVYSYGDFKEKGSEKAVKESGLLRTQGKEYVVQDGDVLHIKHNAK